MQLFVLSFKDNNDIIVCIHCRLHVNLAIVLLDVDMYQMK